MRFDVELSESVEIWEDEILRELKKEKIEDIIYFRDEINEIIMEKGGENVDTLPKNSVLVNLENFSDNTMMNTEKFNFLRDNLWDISLEDLESLVKK